MKALILAAGEGTRLQPISDAVPKHLVPIANKPVIEYIIEDIVASGIEDIGVVISDEKGSPISTHLGTGEEFGVELTYVTQDEPKGLAHAVKCGQEFVGDEPFLVYFGDTLLSPDVTTRLVSAFDETHHAAAVGLQRVADPSRYGIAEFDSAGELAGMQEKPENPPSDLAYVGAVVFSPLVFDEIKSQTPSTRGELELTDSIDRVVRSDASVFWEEVDGLWMDVGKPEDVIKANKLILDGTTVGGCSDLVNVDGTDVVVGPGSEIHDDATIRGPVHVGAETTVGPDAVVGPYASIGDSCTISNAHIKSSVLMNGVEVTVDRGIERSLIGPSTEIKPMSESNSKQYVLGRGTSLYL